MPDLIDHLCLDPEDEELQNSPPEFGGYLRLALVSHMIRKGYPNPLGQRLPKAFEPWWDLLLKIARHENEDCDLPTRPTLFVHRKENKINAPTRWFIESIYLHHLPSDHSIRLLWNAALIDKSEEGRRAQVKIAHDYVAHMKKMFDPLLRDLTKQFKAVGASPDNCKCEERRDLQSGMQRAFDASTADFTSFRDRPTSPKMVALPLRDGRRMAVAWRPISRVELAWSGRGNIMPSRATALVTWDEANDYVSWLRKVTDMESRIEYRLLTRAEWQETMTDHADMLRLGLDCKTGPIREFVGEDLSDTLGTAVFTDLPRFACVKKSNKDDVTVREVMRGGAAALRVARFINS